MLKRFAENLNSWVVLVTSIIALGTAIYSFQQSNTNKKHIEDLSMVARDIQKSFNIKHPANYQIIDTTHFNIHGSYSGNLKKLSDYNFWVIIQKSNGYIRPPGNIIFTAAHKWYLDNAYIDGEGKFKVLIVASNNIGTDFMQTLITSNIYTFSKLPSYGFQVIDFVEIERINKSTNNN